MSIPTVEPLWSVESDLGERLRTDGSCIIRDVFSPSSCDEMLEELRRAGVESERRGWPTFYPDIDPNKSNERIFHLLELSPVFRDLVCSPPVMRAVEAAIGEEFIISNSVANIAHPGSKSMVLHSDLSLVIPEPWSMPWSVNIITCLTDVTFENGGTLHIPRSHLWRGKQDVPANAKDLLVPFEAPAGSMIVMDGRTWHTSGENVTDSESRALILTYYTVPFLRQQINWRSVLSDDVLENINPLLANLLGLEVFANMSLTYKLTE